jgi:hypothetical protein
MRNGKSIKYLLAALPILSAAGCGGTDGLSNGYPSVPPNVNKPVGPGVNGGSQLAVWQPGETWTFNVSGNISKDYINAAGAVATESGPITNGILTRTVNTAPAPYPEGTLEVTDSFSYTIQGGVPTVDVVNRYYSPSTSSGFKTKPGMVVKPAFQTGSLTLVGEDRYESQVQFTSTSGLNIPASFSASTTASNQTSGSAFYPAPVQFVSGGAENYAAIANTSSAFTVLNQESVPAQDGSSYTAWKTQSSLQTAWNNNGLVWSTINALPVGWVIQAIDNESSTDDWVPSEGVSVKTHYTLTETASASLNDAITRTSSGVPETITYNPEVTLHRTETLDLVLAKS